MHPDGPARFFPDGPARFGEAKSIGRPLSVTDYPLRGHGMMEAGPVRRTASLALPGPSPGQPQDRSVTDTESSPCPHP